MVDAIALGPHVWEAVEEYLTSPEEPPEPERPPTTKEEQRAYLKRQMAAERARQRRR